MGKKSLSRILASFCVLGSSCVHALTLSSPAFENGATIPNVFTYSLGGQCSGANQSPPLVFSHVPAGTQSLAITVIDPDGGDWLHWKAWNIPASVTALAANAAAGASFSQATNAFGTPGYGGPCPPTPNHRYIFTLHALNKTFSAEPSISQLQAAALATATLTGMRSPSDNLGWTQPSRQACLFNWAERQLPEYVSPRNPATQQAGDYTVRYYAQTQSYLGFSNVNQHLYFLSGPTGLVDLGAAAGFAPMAACP